MDFLIDLLFGILASLLNILPASPFMAMLASIGDVPVLGVLNWFIPFDRCMAILEIWISAVAAYYAYKNMGKIIDLFVKLKGLF